MRITIDNIDSLPVEKCEQRLLKALLKDLNEINIKGNKKLYFDWQDYHNIYSPERIDPCPDYYGMYRIKYEDNEDETIGIEMTIKDLDIVMCALYNYIVD